MELTNQEIQAIFRAIAFGFGGHGSFLKSLGEAVIRADSENLEILRPSLEKIIEKYNLDKRENKF